MTLIIQVPKDIKSKLPDKIVVWDDLELILNLYHELENSLLISVKFQYIADKVHLLQINHIYTFLANYLDVDIKDIKLVHIETDGLSLYF